jgi:hypothetical protein
MWQEWGGERCLQGFGRPEGKIPLGRPRCREDNINLDLNEIVMDGEN